MTNISRRTFLEGAFAAGTLAVLPNLSNKDKKQVPAKERPINVFSKHLQWLDYEATAATAAEIGFDGVDLTVRPRGHVLPERAVDDLPRAVEAVHNAGLDVTLMTTAIIDPADPLTEPILKTASALGITHYRMGYLNYDDDIGVAASLERYRPQLRDLAAMNEHYGLHGAYQNHAGTRVGGPVWDLWELLKDLDPRWIGCQYDIRHAVVEGGSAWPVGLKLLAGHIQTTVIKDFRWAQRDDGRWYQQNVPVGEGMVDFGSYFEMVKGLDLKGPISMHFEYRMPEDEGDLEDRRRQTVVVMRDDLENARSLMSEAGLDL